MVNLIDLPPEIQYNIYRELFHSQDFVNVCITCRTMNKIATPLLYEMVNISADNDYNWEDRQVRCLTELENRNLPLIKQLLNFCVRKENTKHCLKLIERLDPDQLQCIELFHKHEPHGDAPTATDSDPCAEVVKALFEKNKRFRAIYVDMGEQNFYNTYFDLMAGSCNWLTTLILVIEKKEAFLTDIDAVIKFVKSLKYIRSFELDMVEYFEDAPWLSDEGVRLMDSILSVPTIEQLVFGGSDFPYELYNERYPLKRFGSNLTQFGFFSGVACDRFLYENLDPQRLRALRILWPVEMDFDILTKFLVSFNGLRSLHLTLRNPDTLDSLQCIAHHGKTLERLSLRVWEPQFKPFGRFAHTSADFEELLRKCTALRELAVPLTYVHQWWHLQFRPGQDFDPKTLGVRDILYKDLEWKFTWPNVQCPIESLHILNEPIPMDKNIRQAYTKDRRISMITQFARHFHTQVNIRGIADAITSNSDSDSDSSSEEEKKETKPQGGPPLLPNLRSILFGDNTKCGRDSCLYLHDWEFEEMDLVPVIIERYEFTHGDSSNSPNESDMKILDSKGKRIKMNSSNSTLWQPYNSKEPTTQSSFLNGGKGKGVCWRFKEVDWAEFVGRFPWLHDFEIDARGWMDERTRIPSRDKYRFWE